VVRKGKRDNADDLPLDDPRWLTLTMAHHTRSEQLTGKRFSSRASSHLMEGLKSGKLRCRRESRIDPSKRELVPSSFWQGLRIHEDPDVGVIQFRRDRTSQGETPRDLGQLYDWAYDVWMPDFETLWPAARPVPETRGGSSLRKPGPPPKHEWPLVVAAELIRRAKTGEGDPTAAEMIAHCETAFPDEFSPGLKEMQVLLKKLLLGQF